MNRKNILEEIVRTKQEEVRLKQRSTHKRKIKGDRYSLISRLQDPSGTGIIAEFKRRSPSRGYFKPAGFPVLPIVKAYEEAGVAGISILTDEQYFSGSVEDLNIAAKELRTPILRKDFIIDECQIDEAAEIGADVVLLIAAILTPAQVRRLAVHAAGLDLEVLLEIHAEAELEHICDEVVMVGVNSRNLGNFSVNVEESIKLAGRIPSNRIRIAESGIDSMGTLLKLKEAGFSGFLIGENFMKEEDPGRACQQFINNLRSNNK